MQTPSHNGSEPTHPFTERLVADLGSGRLVPRCHTACNWIQSLDDSLLDALAALLERVLADSAAQSELADALGCVAYLRFLESGSLSLELALEEIGTLFAALRLLVCLERWRRRGLVDWWRGALGDGQSEQIEVALSALGRGLAESAWLN